MDGLKIIRTIQSTDRFEAYEAEYKGQKVFAKEAKIDKARELLARVPQNTQVANRLGQKTDFRFRAPQVYKQVGDWLITEWIEGDSLGPKVDTDLEAVAEILVQFLVVFDHEPARGSEVRKTFKGDSLAAYMVEKLPKDLSAEQKGTVTKAKQLFDSLQDSLIPSWQDGDIKPDHIFTDPKNPDAFVLVDPEHLDPRWPRFYSLANNFVKYWVRGPKEFSIVLTQKFLAKSQILKEDIFRPFMASVLVRGISLHWEIDYDPGAQHYNIPRAQAMLKDCLATRNLDDLLY